jgi:hypothetical protein
MPGQTKRGSITNLVRIAYGSGTNWFGVLQLGPFARVNLLPRP